MKIGWLGSGGREQYDLHALVDGYDLWVCDLLGPLFSREKKRLGRCRSTREIGLVGIEKHL